MNFDLMKNFMDRLTDWRIPGNVINIYRNGEKVFEYASGYSDVEKGERMTPDKWFYLYSCSKITTCLAALQLFEQGIYLLDAPLYDFIPEYKEMFVKNSEGCFFQCDRPITIRHLLTMTAGLNYNLEAPSVQKAIKETGGKCDNLTFAKYLAREPLEFIPGEKWNYSLCHDVLSAFVEAVSGMKFRDYVQKNIFEPAGVTAVYHDTDDVKQKMCMQYRLVDSEAETDIVKMQSSGVSKPGGEIRREGLFNSHILGTEFDSGGAGIITSVPEYAKLLAAIANGGKTASGERLLSPETIDLWRTNQLSDSQKEMFTWPQLKGYGYGLGVRTMVDRALGGSNGPIGEFGWAGAAGAVALMDLENNVSLFYAHHMLNNQESYVLPRLRNVLYACMNR